MTGSSVRDGATIANRGAVTTTSTPVWFGATERPLFGWLEVPEGGTARGGVLLCQPFAVETASAKPTFAVLSGLDLLGGISLRRDRFRPRHGSRALIWIARGTVRGLRSQPIPGQQRGAENRDRLECRHKPRDHRIQNVLLGGNPSGRCVRFPNRDASRSPLVG